MHLWRWRKKLREDVYKRQVLVTMAQRKINAVTSTSAGRLFDGVSAILGIRKASTFEGEASMALEFAAEEWRKSPQRNPETDNLAAPGNLADLAKNSEDAPEDLRKFILNTGEIVRHLTESRLAGEDPRKLAYEFLSLIHISCTGEIWI